ncbi:MAG: CHAP domain-containing protein [Firmicutes bacterium]|nr:CHAP domain-containing protein [Bacillota bacterium]
MKYTKRIFAIVFSFAFVFTSVFTFDTCQVNAASNPYPTQQNVDRDAYYEVPCTWFAWQQVYNNSGKQLHYWGNAVDWWNGARNSGYATGSTPRPGAIAVWSGDTYGHVAYVTSGSGNTFTVNEGGRTDLDHTSSHGVAYGYTLTNAVGARRPYDTNKILLGFIYPGEASTPTQTISWGNFACQPKTTDARIEARATAPFTGTFTQAGVVICDNTNKQVASKTENINTTYSYLNIWYDITAEIGVSLRPGSKYYYQYWVVFNGTKYLSPVQSFQTTGTCSHVWTNGIVTTAPTYTSTGIKTYTCMYCAGKGTQTVAKLVLNAPENVSLTTVASSGKPKLSWNKVTDAGKYEVWRKVGSSGTYEKYTTTSSTSVTHTEAKAGTTYYYKIKAIYSKNSEVASAYSKVVNITCDLPAPTGVKVSNNASSGKPKVRWNAVDGSSKYYVYRATSKNGSYQYLGSTANTHYTNTGAVAGNTYYYKVKAVHPTNEYAYSAQSASTYITCDLPVPTGVKVSNNASSGKPKVRWNAVDGASKYYVYRATSKNGAYTYLGSTENTHYTNTSATAGNTYYYKVKAVHPTNEYAYSAQSANAYITCDLPAPTGVKVSRHASSGKPKVRWNAVNGASKYYVYRATSKTGTYKYIGATTNTHYTNTGATAGNTYYYKVKAVHPTNEYAYSAQSSFAYIAYN